LADGPHALKLTITDTAGNTNAGSIYNVVVDTVSPTLILSTAAADPTNLNPFTVTATFAEAVTGLTLADITVTNGATVVNSFTAVSATVYTFQVAPAADGKIEISIGASAADDTAGNGSLASNTLVRVYDGTAPTVALATPATPATKAPFTVTATFSEPVTGLVVGDITTTNGATVGSFNAISDTVYTFVITPTAQGQVDVSIATGMAIDVASNGNVASATLSRVYDTVAPGVSLASTAADPTNGSFTVTATFTEPVFGFDLGDLNLQNATASALTGSGTTYSFVITAVADGAVSVDVKNVGALDAASNGNTATSAPLTRVIDTVRPQVTISSASATLLNAAFSVDIDFPESVSGLTASDFTVTGGTAGTLSGSGKAYQLTINPTLGQSSSTVAISLLANNATDAAGNLNTASNSVSRTFDDIQPTASVSIGFFNSKTNRYPATVTFSEPVTGFDINTDLTLTGLNAANQQGSGTTYTFDLALVGNTNNTISVSVAAVTDDAGNSSIVSSTVAVISDIISPNASMVVSAPYLNIANKSTGITITVTLTDPLPTTLGDPISGIALASFPATLSSTSAVSITRISYNPVAPTSGSTTTKASATYTVVPTSPAGWMDLTGTTIVASLGTSAYTDAAGNNGSSDVSVDFKVDVVAPELLSADRTKPVANSEEFNRIDMVFSEPVFNVTNAGYAAASRRPTRVRVEIMPSAFLQAAPLLMRQATRLWFPARLDRGIRSMLMPGRKSQARCQA
jgi:hypothetical protein